MSMESRETFFAEDRGAWRRWLEKNFQSKKEIWLISPLKESGEKSISYNDAVEEALCFGWIDGRYGRLDELHGMRRFTPRRKGSEYSRPNVERLILMEKEGKIHPSVRESVSEIIFKPFVFPEDIIAEIRKVPDAWKNYQKFSEPYKRIRVAYVDAARDRPEEFQKRLRNFLIKTEKNKIISGYGGVEKYYRFCRVFPHAGEGLNLRSRNRVSWSMKFLTKRNTE